MEAVDMAVVADTAVVAADTWVEAAGDSEAAEAEVVSVVVGP
jgi:hypothetical protein